jgi:hypothetical protein
MAAVVPHDKARSHVFYCPGRREAARAAVHLQHKQQSRQTGGMAALPGVLLPTSFFFGTGCQQKKRIPRRARLSVKVL